jgi:hypothetical protein
MPLLPTGVRRRLRDRALAASRRLSTGPEWERHVRDELDLLAPGEAWRDTVADGFHRLYYERGKERDDFEVDRSREKLLFTFNPGGWLRKVG